MVEFEGKSNFVWALEILKGLFLRVYAYLRVTISDRDITLTNIGVVFPEACNVLC